MRAEELQKIAHDIRLTTFKKLAQAGNGHWGGSFSQVEIITTLYYSEMKIDPQNPQLEDRDRFILSKGHASPSLYTLLAKKGFFPIEWLDELEISGGKLPKHADRFKAPGVDVSTGSLGQGLSVGVGTAFGSRVRDLNSRTYVLIGDGECNEGMVWEAAMTAAKYKLDNLVAIVDDNGVQCDGSGCDIMPIDPLDEKWKAFNWNVIKIDGHNIQQILDAFKEARETKGKPTVIIANTVKGKGISFMEGKYQWHNGAITPEQINIGMSELEGASKSCC